jgi:hypothetical protein
MNEPKKAAVWQVKESEFPRTVSFVETSEGLRFPLDYECVAMIESTSLEEIFRLTNHIDRPWWENDEVEVRKKGRSTSVGDVVVMPDNKTLYLCLAMGWKRYEGVPQQLPANLYTVKPND